ncbi:MAG TPA: GNAT family N-acetyltransferase [Roseiflexaceae bacterium]|nr:GNAT family N-acetyltransferase [Roseiflexaceae bacterium]HMP39307.1 GNAT family N-acetyltransferase [Roseiflexaceae bacterium]
MSAAINSLMLRPAAQTETWAIQGLFEALHRYNASLDPLFALADGWEHVLAEHLSHTLTTGHGLTLLAWAEDLPIGLLMINGHTDSPLFLHRQWAEILALYVAPNAQGCGVADGLLDAGLAWARERGYARIQLYVTATNVRARRFYTRMGFQPVQEIWRREFGSIQHTPPDDPTCAVAYAHGHDLLVVHPHHLIAEEPCQ